MNLIFTTTKQIVQNLDDLPINLKTKKIGEDSMYTYYSYLKCGTVSGQLFQWMRVFSEDFKCQFNGNLRTAIGIG